MKQPQTNSSPPFAGKRRQAGLALASTLLTVLGALACSSFQTAGDFQRALERAQAGEAAAVVKDLREAFAGMNEEQRLQTVAVLDQIPGSESGDFLKEIARNGEYQKRVREAALASVVRRDEPGSPAVVRDVITQNPGLLSQPAAEYLVKKDPDGTPKAFMGVISADSKSMNAPMAEYFGKKKHKAAIPALQAAVESGQVPKASVQALADMEDADADNFLFEVAGKPDHPMRAEALKAILAQRAQTHPKRSGALLGTILTEADQQPEDLALLAIDLSPKLANSPGTKEQLRKIYTGSTKPELRTRALDALSRIENTSAFVLSRELHVSLIGLQVQLAGFAPDDRRTRHANASPEEKSEVVVRVARKDPLAEPASSSAREPIRNRAIESKTKKSSSTVVQPPRARRRSTTRSSRAAHSGAATKPAGEYRIPKSANYPRSSAAYRGHFMNFLRETLPEEDARAIYGRVSNALRVYADSGSPSARFVRRAYEKEFGTSDPKALSSMLSQGVGQPGSVHAILLGIYREYGDESMRIYALSQLFDLPRWQASLLIEFVRR